MAKDKQLHILLCLVATPVFAGIVALARVIGTPAAATIGGCLLAGAYERLQAYRREGEPSWADFWHGVGGSVAAGLALQMAGVS